MGNNKPRKGKSLSSWPGGRHKPTTNFARLWTFVRREVFTLNILFDHEHFNLIASLLLLAESIVLILVINFVRYTEIDWSTYMQQVECFLNGTLEYSQISGDTGPVVYPAGHLYIYTCLYYLTSHGTNIFLAQYIFAALYLVTLILVFRLYRKYSKIPPYVLIFMCCTSYRVHSIYVLRLFNDPVAMLFLYASLNAFTSERWSIGSIFYSLAVSLKMNVLLFAPALFLAFVERLDGGWLAVLKQLTICATVQILLGLPFLLTHPISYVHSAFNLGRVFLHKWTVNYRFLPEDVFVDRRFHLLLLALHLIVLLAFYHRRWWRVVKRFFTRSAWVGKKARELQVGFGKNEEMLLTMFTVNLIGIAFSRSLHYQFYVWYYHSLPWLLWSTRFSPMINLCLWGFVELAWNCYPSTAWSSALLHFVHILLLVGLAATRCRRDNNNTNAGPKVASVQGVDVELRGWDRGNKKRK